MLMPSHAPVDLPTLLCYSPPAIAGCEPVGFRLMRLQASSAAVAVIASRRLARLISALFPRRNTPATARRRFGAGGARSMRIS